MTLTESELKERIERLEARFEKVERLMKDLAAIIRQVDADLGPLRRINSSLFPRDMEGR
jgi:chaperonin cofactor prefoldin